MSVQKDNEKQNPGGFKPGFDPRRNRSGRKKRDELGLPVIDTARSYGIEMLQILVDIARDTTAKEADRIKAADKVITRGYGAAKQTIEINGALEHQHITAPAIDVATLDPALRRALLDHAERNLLEGQIIETNETSAKLADASQMLARPNDPDA